MRLTPPRRKKNFAPRQKFFDAVFQTSLTRCVSVRKTAVLKAKKQFCDAAIGALFGRSSAVGSVAKLSLRARAKA